MAIIRRIYRLQAYLKPIHFRYLGHLLLVMTLLWFYLTFAEYLTGYYGNEPEEMKVFWSKFTGPFWPFFWAMVACNLVIPIVLLVRLRHRAVGKTVVASVSVVVGMWLERFNIVVPTLANPRLPFPEGQYWPTWIEWGELAASFGLFILFYVLFVKLFPIISIWEIQEGREVGLKEVEERLRSYLPDGTMPEAGHDREAVPR
jgi:molybdopterin-containing oxidoreductase family membrane subunit